jgi:hydrogenase maturation protease
MTGTHSRRGSPGSPPRVIVVGLGNPILGDDGVGWRVADELVARLENERAAGRPFPGVDVERLGVGGLRLMELLSGNDAAILVDAAEFPDRPAGEVRVSPLDELPDHGGGHLDNAHDATLVTALALGRRLGAELPARIDAVTVQATATDTFGEELSPPVEAAIPAAVEAVLRLLREIAGQAGRDPRRAPAI